MKSRRWKKTHERVCIVCGKVFRTTRPTKKTCSNKCSKQRHREVQKEWVDKNRRLRTKIQSLLELFKQQGYTSINIRELSKALAQEMGGELILKYENLLLEEVVDMGYQIRIGSW